MGADVVMVSIACVCEKGNLWKTALKDDEDRPAAFALVYAYGKNIIYFRGYCSGCGKIFEYSYVIESMLHYKEVA